MNKIDSLLAHYCPDGIEYKQLRSVCSDFIVPMRDKPKVFGGTIPWCRIEDIQGQYLHTSLSGSYVSEDTIKKMNLKVFPTGTVICSCSASLGTYAINTQPLITNQTFIGIVCGDDLNNKYLFYLMHIMTNKLVSISNSGTIPYISRKKFEDLIIPVPPLPIQQEIVNILDKFTQLESELQAELEVRKVQFEYYRNELLSFNDENIEWRSLGGKNGIAEIGTGSKNTIDADKNGLYDFYVRSPEILKLGCYDFDEEAIITSGDGVGVGKILHYVNGKYALHQRAYRFRIREKNIRTKYVFWYLKKNFLKYILGNAVNSSVSSLRMPVLEKLMIAIPSLEEQDKIIAILDKFELLINDLNIGLPAEIAARKKQYEYYRNKLLTFKPLKNG